MEDLSKSHVDKYKEARGIMRLENEGWLVGVVGGVEVKLDRMLSITVRGTYADGTEIEKSTYEVPASVAERGPVSIVEYLVDKYGIKP